MNNDLPMKSKRFPIRYGFGLVALLFFFFLTACQKHQEKPWQYFGDNTAETQAAESKTQSQATP